MTKASIAIFPHKAEYAETDNSTRPNTPPEVFEAALRVQKTQGCEIVRVSAGMYIVQYSETGPGQQHEGWNGWHPVYVARIQNWVAGGIRESEMADYLETKARKESENASTISTG